MQASLGDSSKPTPITDESVAEFARARADDGSAVIISSEKVLWVDRDDIRTGRPGSTTLPAAAAGYPAPGARPRMKEQVLVSPPLTAPIPGKVTAGVSAEKLMARYEVNEFDADWDFAWNKSLYVDGVITRINHGGPEGNYIELLTDDLIGRIRCYFNPRQAQRFRLAQKGDLASIRGLCIGRPIYDVILEDCRLITTVRPRVPLLPWEYPEDTSRRVRIRKGYEFIYWPQGLHRYEVTRDSQVIHNESGHTVRDGQDYIFTEDGYYWGAVRRQAPAWVGARKD